MGVMGMKLRTKLFLGYLVFTGALIVLGAWSGWHLREMGGVARNILANNYDSIVAAQEMRESLDRQEVARLGLLLGEGESVRQDLTEARLRFDAALQSAVNNITEPGEAETIAALTQDRDAYYRQVDGFLAAMETPPSSPTGRIRGDWSGLAPWATRLREDCKRLLQINQQAMVAKAEAATRVATRWFRTTLGIAAALVVAGVLFALFLAHRIVRPLSLLRATATRIAGGDLDATAEIAAQDEVGQLAEDFNRMAERIRAVRRSDLGQLLIAQQTTEAAIDSLYDPVIVTDAPGAVTRLNPAAEEIFGPAAGHTGRPIEAIAGGNKLAVAVAEALHSQQPVAGEGITAVLPLAVDGAERAFRLRTTPMHDGEGRLLGAVSLLEDVTHLREVDRMKSEFIATASHELRTPLTSVQMNILLLLEEAGSLSAAQRDLLESCRRECARLERLTHDLLDLSRIEAGQQAPKLLPIALGDAVASAVETVRPRATRQGIALTIQSAPALPPAFADRLQIERVVINLLSNALHATPPGGAVRVTVEPRENGLSVAIADTGHGIPAEYLPHIFDRFVQVPGDTAGGAGLGLAIAKRIVEAHGGHISVHSEPGRGTTF
ncbi:MAG TPA: ATP-binding protein, partial [Candidatus Methylomirabilis sp.]